MPPARPGAGLTSKPLHARRPGSPYVGRFARGWHRLPGLIPGQPQTRTGAPPEYGTASRVARTTRSRRTVRAGPTVGEGPAGRDDVDLPNAGLGKDRGTGGYRRARGEDVVHQEDPRRRRAAGGGCERTVHRPQPLLTRPTRLRGGGRPPPDEGDRWEVELAGEGACEHARLIEPALGPPPASERHPRHGVGRRRAERRHGGRERLPPPLATPRTSACGRRRGPAPDTRTRERAESMGAGGQSRQESTSVGAGRPQRRHHGGCRGTRAAAQRSQERPRARTAPGTGPGEEDVDRSIEHRLSHGGTLRGAADTLRAAGPRSGRRPGRRS